MAKSYIGQLFEISRHERVSSNSIIGLLGQTSYSNYDALMRGSSSKEELEDLKYTLEFFYYGKHSDNISNQAYAEVANAFQTAVEKEMQDIVQGGVNGITEDVLVKEKIGKTKHTNYITVGTVQDRATKANELLKELNGSLKKRYANVGEIGQVLAQIVKESEDILKDVSQEKLSSKNGRAQIQLQDNRGGSKTLRDLVEQFDANWIKISQAKKYVSMARLGALGEKGDTMISKLVTASTLDNAKQLVADGLKNVGTVGNVKASADQLMTIKPKVGFTDEHGNFLAQTVWGEKQRNNQTIRYTYQAYERGEDGAEASVSVQALNNFNQKMDVRYIGPSGESYRVSRKNWSTMGAFQNDKGEMQEHDLGDTILYNALLRTANYDPTIAFGLATGWDKSRDIIGLSKWAQSIAVLDIIAGIGQKTAVGAGYADTLVIQDRSLQEFHVFSIAELIKGLLVNGEAQGFHLVGYNEDAIANNGMDYHSPLGPQGYAAVIASILKAQEITVAYTNDKS